MNNLTLLRWAGGNLSWPPQAFIDKILSHCVVTESGCWEWAKGKIRGYGNVRWGPVNYRVHRVTYEYAKGPIPKELQIDHLCRNRGCCNPDHLEAVTARENLMRGETAAAKNAAKTHCPKGHSYKVYPDGRRRCSVCELASEKIRRPGHHY